MRSKKLQSLSDPRQRRVTAAARRASPRRDRSRPAGRVQPGSDRGHGPGHHRLGLADDVATAHVNAAVQRVREHSPGYTNVIVTVVVVALAGFGVLFDWGEGDSDPNALAASIAILVAAAVCFRRRNPIALLLVVAAAHLFLAWDTGNEVALLPASAVALFTVARHADRNMGLMVATAVGLVIAVGVAVFDADRFLPEFLGAAALIAIPIAVGDAAQSRAERIRDLIDTEANSRVQAERIRIARDLHDIVAHGLSAIAIQSGVAAHLLDRDPDQAKEALEVINATGKSSLEELRVMVGLLRSTDDAPLRPTPTDPNDLTDLLDGAANADIIVAVDTTGSFPPDVGDSCVLAMHRIIQEALTNVARHAGAAVPSLRIDHAADHVEVHITNEGGTAPNAALESTGVGIIGMRERAESLGGTLTAEPTASGGFRVTAVLPYNVRRTKAP